MVAVLVVARELQVAVEEEAGRSRRLGDDHPLVRRLRDVDDGRAEVERLGRADQVRHPRGGGAEGDQRERAPDAEAQRHPAIEGEEERPAQGHQRVQDPERDRRLVDAEPRQEHRGEEDATDERADVVEAEHPRDEVLQVEREAQQAEEERDLQAHQGADDHHQGVEPEAEGAVARVDLEQERRRQAAGDRDAELDLDEPHQEVALDVLRDPAAEPHRAQVEADHQAELGDRVAQDVAGEGPRDELVDQAAGRDDEHRRQERRRHQALTQRCRRHRARSYHVLLASRGP